MATLQTQDANILEAEAVNWRLIVYPLLGILILVVGGLAIYYYEQGVRDQAEADARQAMVSAKTPVDLVQVADRFPSTTQGNFALLSAGALSMNAKDFAGAEREYGRVAGAAGTDPMLRDSAEIGLGSALEADHKPDDAIKSFLAVAQRGDKSPYAPYAYACTARLYEQKKDTQAEREILTEAASLQGDSEFTKEAQSRLKGLNSSAQTPSAPSPINPAKSSP